MSHVNFAPRIGAFKRGLLYMSIGSSMLLAASAAQAGSWVYGSYGNGYGTRSYQAWVPTGYAQGQAIPLVVALHGCGETPADFAGLTRINSLADSEKFMVLYPAQGTINNPLACWNWYTTNNQGRFGEPSIIKGMIDKIKGSYTINNSKVYVFGLSAGGAMTSTMLSCYSEVFAAGGIGEGLMYKAATNAYEAGNLAYGSSYAPTLRGYDAWLCSGTPHPRYTPVIVFQGSADTTVTPINASQVVAQFVQTNDYSDDGFSNGSVVNSPTSSHNGSAGGRSYTYWTYHYGNQDLLQYYTIYGMAHTWSGGNPAYSAVSTAGPDATTIMWNFFKSHHK